MLDFEDSHLLFKLVVLKRLQRSMHPVKGCLFRNPSRIKTIQQSRRYGKCFNGSNRYLTLFKQQHRPQWSRNKSFPGPQPNKPSPKPLQEKPPIPVSTATKNKLSNFQFHGPPNDGNNTKAVISLLSDDEKENEGAKKEKVDEMPREIPKNASPEQPKLPEPAPKDVPTTPAGRLALTDLIGMGDIRRAVQNISPDERIEWNHEKDLMPGQGSAFGGIRRARKRARSSSPTGSPSAQSSPHFNPKFELISISSQVDPGSELWGRYSLNGSNARTPRGPSIPALAHLMCTSSPQPSKEGVTPRSASGFRRANSCGNQFPKRRRVGGYEGDDVFTESAAIGPSKLAVLIERVQEGLTPKQPSVSTTTSESFHTPVGQPSPHIEDTKLVDDNRSEDSKVAHQPRPPRTEVDKPKTESTIAAQTPKPDIPSSSDYGEFDDDELDESLMEIFVEGTAPTLRVSPNPRPQTLDKARDRYRPPPQVKTAESSESGTLKSGSDEFDDSDEDLFAVDLENIASQFDTKTHGKSKAVSVGGAGASGQREALVRAKSESEDEFGDGGLDDLDFEAAEATATQPIQQTANSLLPVRTRFP
jgi:DNA replication ATP-dependent helicase Dna2